MKHRQQACCSVFMNVPPFEKKRLIKDTVIEIDLGSGDITTQLPVVDVEMVAIEWMQFHIGNPPGRLLH